MTIILPEERFGIHDLENRMTNVDFKAVMNQVSGWWVHKVTIPKFKIEQKFELKDMFTEVKETRKSTIFYHFCFQI